MDPAKIYLIVGVFLLLPLSLHAAPQTKVKYENEVQQKYADALNEGDLQKANQLQRSMGPYDTKATKEIYIKWKKKNEAERDKKLTKERKEFAKTYELKLLNQGIDAYASASGKNNTTLKIKYILTSRPLVHKLINNPDFMVTLQGLGFKKLIMTDGYDSTWEVKI